MDELVVRATNNFTKIISTDEIEKHYPELDWGTNGSGNRWANGKFNITVIYSDHTTRTYSDNAEDTIPADVFQEFLQCVNGSEVKPKGRKIIGRYVHSKKTDDTGRPISVAICRKIRSRSCVVCGTRTTICDHKNDLYNDARVLNTSTQNLDDFQPLCNHCNLQKRQVCITEKQTDRIYSAKNIQQYAAAYPYEFPWEKKAFDVNDPQCKEDTYWYDPVEFTRKIHQYSTYVLPIIREIKRKVTQNRLRIA